MRCVVKNGQKDMGKNCSLASIISQSTEDSLTTPSQTISLLQKAFEKIFVFE